MKKLVSMIAAAWLAVPGLAQAEQVRIQSMVPVDSAVANMTAAISAAGARVFTTVDFAKGSASVGETLRPTTLIIFGSPKIGAGALQDGQTMGLYLPLKVLAYEDADGDVWLSYESPASAAAEHGIAPDHPAVKSMAKALASVTAKANGGS